MIREYAGLPDVECIAAQINQVFMNLLVNAAHAIAERGTITLRTGFDEREVWVEVEDTGVGIKPENLKRVFEPFLRESLCGDGDREMSSPLTRYYTESGCPPGTWVGTGLMSLDDGRTPALAEGDTVTEEHLARLLGDGIHPITGEQSFHTGTDFAAADGTPILAAADGTVTVAEFSGGYGGLVVIEHRIDGRTVATAYAHSWQHGIHVSVGDQVRAGQHIADVGSSGMSTGPHLHFEVRDGGTNGEFIDPAAWLKL